jgi:putative transposase
MIYSHSLTAEEFSKIEHILEPHGTGRPPKHSKHVLLNAILYILNTGCQWRNLPQEFPKWQTVATTFYRWRDFGYFEAINKFLAQESESQPQELALDSRSVRASADLQKKTKALMVINASRV